MFGEVSLAGAAVGGLNDKSRHGYKAIEGSQLAARVGILGTPEGVSVLILAKVTSKAGLIAGGMIT